jgi:hypothetical protein
MQARLLYLTFVAVACIATPSCSRPQQHGDSATAAPGIPVGWKVRTEAQAVTIGKPLLIATADDPREATEPFSATLDHGVWIAGGTARFPPGTAGGGLSVRISAATGKVLEIDAEP